MWNQSNQTDKTKTTIRIFRKKMLKIITINIFYINLILYELLFIV